MIGSKWVGLLITVSLGVILSVGGDRKGVAAAGPGTLLTEAIAEDPRSPGTVPRFGYVAK
jgi:hypothetical protein